MAIPTSFSLPSKWFTKPTFNLNFPRRLPNSKSTNSKPKKLVEAAFRHLDANGDGKISGDELRSYFASVGDPLTRDGARRVIEDFDGDGDEMLELEEFVRLVEGEAAVEDDLRRAFEMFEVEKGCGFIAPAGLQKMFARLGYVKSCDECMAMIRVFDLDGDGVIDFHEFLVMMA